MYGYSAYGGNDSRKDLYDAFVGAADDHGLTMEFCGGAFSFTSDESFRRQEADTKRQ